MDKCTGTRVLRGTLIALAVTASLAGQSSQAADSTSTEPRKASKQENIGVFTGLVIGAVAGGPVGAVVGAGAGGLLGERYHRQLVAKQELAADLGRSESERQSLQGERTKLAAALEHTRDLGAQVQFRTDDATLESDAVERLARFGALAVAVPDLKVRVCGYADPRGGSAHNLALSQRRAEAVAAVLAQSGVSADRLLVEAYGSQSSTSADGDLDGYALERRVTVRLEGASGGKLAQAQ